MRVKVNSHVFDSIEEPICIVLFDQDKENIKNMDPNCTKYCSYPEAAEKKEIEQFMSDPRLKEVDDAVEKPAT